MGERLSVGVTLVLTIEVSRSAVAAVLPVCGELLWLEVFFMLNLMFTCISLAESCVVLSLAYYTGEDPLPASLRECVAIARRTMRRSFSSRAIHAATAGTQSTGSSSHSQGSMAARLVRTYSASAQGMHCLYKRGRDAIRMDPAAASTPGAESTPVVRFDVCADGEASPEAQGCGHRPQVPLPDDLPPRDPIRGAVAASRPTRHDGSSSPQDMRDGAGGGVGREADQASVGAAGDAGLGGGGATSFGDESSRLLFFENLFFQLDVDGSDDITFDEMRRMLTFVGMTMSDDEREVRGPPPRSNPVRPPPSPPDAPPPYASGFATDSLGRVGCVCVARASIAGGAA